MWKGKKVSVVFSTYNEKDSVRKEINDCFETGFVDEIIVVNNNAAKGTEEEVAKTKAKQVFETRQGFGHGYRRALKEATGDVIIMTEPDGTYNHKKDLEKLLLYSDDFPVVLGTRTTQALIGEGANMGVFLKWGNVFVGKLIEVLFNTTHLSDAGCTLSLLSKDALKQIQRYRVTQKGVYEMIEEIPFSDTKGDYLIASGGIPLAEIEVKPSDMMWTSLPTIFRFPQGEVGETFSHVPDFMASPRQVTLELGGPSKGRTPFKQMYARAIEYYKKRCLSTVSQE